MVNTHENHWSKIETKMENMNKYKFGQRIGMIESYRRNIIFPLKEDSSILV